MSNTDFDTHLKQQIEQLPKEIQPERDLWPGIELTLTTDSVTNSEVQHNADKRVKWLAMAAAFAFVGLFSFFVSQQFMPGNNSLDLVAALIEQHQIQKNQLLVKFKDQPALTQNWQEQLRELDEAAGAIKKALEQDPTNIALLKMLQQVHQQQIDLIERVHSPTYLQI